MSTNSIFLPLTINLGNAVSVENVRRPRLDEILAKDVHLVLIIHLLDFEKVHLSACRRRSNGKDLLSKTNTPLPYAASSHDVLCM